MKMGIAANRRERPRGRSQARSKEAADSAGTAGGTGTAGGAAPVGGIAPIATSNATGSDDAVPKPGLKRTGTFMVIWSPAGDSAGELLWQAGLCLTAKKQAAVLADLDLYTPGLAVAAGMLTPGKPAPAVLDACLTQQAPALTVSVGPDGYPVPGRRPTPRLLQPDGQPLLRVLPGLIDLRGIDMLVPPQLDAIAAWLKSEPGWRIATVSAPCDCAATLACLAAADRLVLYVPHHTGRRSEVAQLWLARAAHLLDSLPGVRARAELWLSGWDAATAREVGVHLQRDAHVLPVGGRRRTEALAQLLGLKGERPAAAPRGEIVAVR